MGFVNGTMVIRMRVNCSSSAWLNQVDFHRTIMSFRVISGLQDNPANKKVYFKTEVPDMKVWVRLKLSPLDKSTPIMHLQYMPLRLRITTATANSFRRTATKRSDLIYRFNRLIPRKLIRNYLLYTLRFH